MDYRGEFLRALRRREWSRTIKQPKGNPQDCPISTATASAVTARLSAKKSRQRQPWLMACNHHDRLALHGLRKAIRA